MISFCAKLLMSVAVCCKSYMDTCSVLKDLKLLNRLCHKF